MNDLYREPYFNRRNWILEKSEELKLNPLMLSLILLIDYANEFRQVITPDMLAKKTTSSHQEIDEGLKQLVKLNYLDIRLNDNQVAYDISKLFEPKKTGKMEISLVERFETEFKRPLGSSELHQLRSWVEEVGEAYVIHALRESLSYGKLSMAYLNRILLSWKERKLTLEDLDMGKQHEKT